MKDIFHNLLKFSTVQPQTHVFALRKIAKKFGWDYENRFTKFLQKRHSSVSCWRLYKSFRVDKSRWKRFFFCAGTLYHRTSVFTSKLFQTNKHKVVSSLNSTCHSRKSRLGDAQIQYRTTKIFQTAAIFLNDSFSQKKRNT